MKIRLLLLSLIAICAFNINGYSLEENKMSEKTVDLVKKFNLYGVDKIEIVRETSDKEVKGIKFVIDDKASIEKIINGLMSVNEMPLCDCWPEFRLLFYKQKQQVLDLGFQNNCVHCYLRYDNKEQFLPTEDLFHFLNNIIIGKK